VTRYPKASAISSPPRLLRLLPAGAIAGWDLHPLESATFPRRTGEADITIVAQGNQSVLIDPTQTSAGTAFGIRGFKVPRQNDCRERKNGVA
jgi:hypothetical protein